MALELRFLGDFEVLHDGRAAPLPPSKKTRALLAYLCLQPRRLRREQLCELLWEIPDDPRGSLRWSLSKIRRLLDDDAGERIVADRNSVGIDNKGLAIDVRDLRELVGGGLAAAALATLEAAAGRQRGAFLEGLEFSSFPTYHAWCMAVRQQALHDHAALRSELIRRLADDPRRALPHARALVALFPYEEDHRATLIRLLGAARQAAEAEEQYQLGLRMLKEVGAVSSGALLAARRVPASAAQPAAHAAMPPGGASADDAAAVAPPQRLVGREQEVELLAQALADAVRQRRAAIWFINGPPGIGKSRVLEAVLAHARLHGAFVLRAAAFESDTIRPFSLWADALRAHDPALYAGVLGGADITNRDRLFAALSDLLAQRGAAAPVVLLFDDAQWCDESSAAALHYVARMNPRVPLFGVLATRSGELHDNAPLQQAMRGLRRDALLHELELGPLSREALMTLIAEQAPGVDSERLSVECGGNALLAIELARAERAGGASGGSINDLVRERLARCGPIAADVLRWAAVLSPRIDVGTLAGVSGIGVAEVGAALEAAQRHALLRPTEQGLRFAHELIARAVYTELSPLRRQVMHRRVAEMLERDTAQDLARAADLAHHARQSEDPGLAARALVSAGRLCLRFFANDDARSLARSGLQLAAALPDAERVRVEIDLNDILLAAGALADREAAARQFSALAERALDHGALSHARLGYHMAATVRWQQGHWNAAREQTLQAVRVVRGGQDEAHIVGVAETAKCLVMIERDLAQADALLMEAGALAQRKGFNHHAIAAGRGLLRFRENRLDEAEELFREARTLCKAEGDRVAEFQINEYLVMLDLLRGRQEAARERCNELLRLGEKLRGGSEAPLARALLGLCNYAIDDEVEGLDAALADLRIADAKHRLAYVLTRTAMIDCERGRVERALAHAAEALDHATQLERATEMLIANAVLSHCCAKQQRRSESQRHAREVERLTALGAAVWANDLVQQLKRRQAARREVAQ